MESEPIADSLWDAYCSTVLTFTDDERNQYKLIPTPGQSGKWLNGSEIKEVFIISAANPYSEKLSDDANARYERQMIQDLTKAKAKFRHCMGQSPDGRWKERSLMVFDAPVQAIKELGERYLQNAIFRWTPHSWEGISLVSNQHFVTGWTLVAH